MAADFEIADRKFQVGNLKVKVSLQVFKKLSKTLLPAWLEAGAAGADKIGEAAQRVVENLDCLDDLLDAFTRVTKATWPGRDTPTELAPEQIQEAVFGGRPEVLLEYLGRCVVSEYGQFLKENGLLGPLLAKMNKAGLATPADD